MKPGNVLCDSRQVCTGKEAPARCRHRWNDIKMNLKEIGLKGMEWINLAQDWDKCAQ